MPAATRIAARRLVNDFISSSSSREKSASVKQETSHGQGGSLCVEGEQLGGREEKSPNPKPQTPNPKSQRWDVSLGFGTWDLRIWDLRLVRSRRGSADVLVEPLDGAVPRELGRRLVVAFGCCVVVEAVHRALVDVPFVRHAGSGERLVVV